MQSHIENYKSQIENLEKTIETNAAGAANAEVR
jgi:hypothetical protein